MREKIRFYRGLIIEIIETLCTICLFLEYEGRIRNNRMTPHMRSHFNELKIYSGVLRDKEKRK